MRLVGFYSLIDRVPAPIVPLFSRGHGAPYFAQIVGSDGNIEGFVEASQLDESRLISFGEEYSEINSGARAMFAIKLADDHIVLNNIESIRKDVRTYLHSSRNSSAPFSSLDLSLFLGDVALIEENAERCRRHLEATAPRVTARWIDGAPLTSELKQKLRNRQIELDGPEPPSSGVFRLGFTGYSELMSGITAYCAQQLGGRARAFRMLLGESSSAKQIRDSTSFIDFVLDGIIQRYPVNIQSTPIAAWMTSRGRIDFVAFDQQAIQIAIENFHMSVESSELYLVLSTKNYFIRGREFKNFVLLNCLLMSDGEGYVTYYRDLVTADIPNPLQGFVTTRKR